MRNIKNLVVDTIGKLFKNDNVTRSSFKDKVDTYEHISKLLRKRADIKIAIIKNLNDKLNNKDYNDELEGLRLVEEIVQAELEMIDIEVEIEAKNFYTSTYSNMARYFEETQQRVSAEADIHLGRIVGELKSFSDNPLVDDKKRAIAHGLISRFYGGIRTTKEKNALYLEMKDALKIIESSIKYNSNEKKIS